MDSFSIAAGFSGDLQTAIEAAKAGVAVIRSKLPQFIGSGGHQQLAEQKEDSRGLVTATDYAAEKAILAVLSAKSSHGILSEESGEYISESDSELRWIVDPLDGTTNFSRGVPQFAVSIALAKGSHSTLGVISNPLTGDYYYAERGKGAFCNSKPLSVSKTTDPTRTLIVVNHGYQRQDRVFFSEAVSRFMLDCYLRKFGSTAIELAYLSQGLIDAWVCSGDELWDFAAGLVLVEEAGGKVTDWCGNPWTGAQRDIVVTNGPMHDYVVERLCGLRSVCDLTPE